MNKYDNSGAVFVNDKKEKDSHPDRSGSCMIEGREYWISGWIKSGAKGQFLSLAFKPKDAKPDAKTVQRGPKPDHFEPDADIPW